MNRPRAIMATAAMMALLLGCNNDKGPSGAGGSNRNDAKGASEAGGSRLGKFTNENVLKLSEDMGIDDAKIILGPPTKDAEAVAGRYAEWGDITTVGKPYVRLDYDSDTRKITAKRIVSLK